MEIDLCTALKIQLEAFKQFPAEKVLEYNIRARKMSSHPNLPDDIQKFLYLCSITLGIAGNLALLERDGYTISKNKPSIENN